MLSTILMHVTLFIVYSLDCVISFLSSSFDRSPQTYIVNEDDGPAQPVLVLSNPSSTDITVQVIDTNVSANGEY